VLVGNLDRGTDCRYQLAAGGPSLPLRAILSAPDREMQLGQVGLVVPDMTASVLIAELAEPQAGDVLLDGDTAYTVSWAERDAERTRWMLHLRADADPNMVALRLATAAQ